MKVVLWWFLWLIITSVGLLAVAIAIPDAKGAPPEGVDLSSPMSQWYESLKVPSGSLKGNGCCSVADCRPVQYRMAGSRYEAFVDRSTFPDEEGEPMHGAAPNAWLPVPEEAVIRPLANPTGSAVLCWYAGTIRCFVPGGAT